MSSADISNISLDGEIGSRFDRFAYERLYGEFAITEILGEAEKCLTEQYDDEFSAGSGAENFGESLLFPQLESAKCKATKN